MRELRAYRVPEDGVSAIDHDIPLRIRILQTRFKHALRGLVSDVLNEDPEIGFESPAKVRLNVLRKFRAMQLMRSAKDQEMVLCTYGHVFDVKVDAAPHHPDMLAIGVIIDVCWDEDESLYIFQSQNSRWVNLLAAEVNGNAQVWGAQSSRFNYAISPTGPDGSWFLVTSSVNPHLASAWQQVTYTALAPGPDAGHPKVLVQRTHLIYLIGSDDESHACWLKATATGFRASFTIDASPWAHRYIDEYRVAQGRAVRIRSGCRAASDRGKPTPCENQK
jgi:hypothetical protein